VIAGCNHKGLFLIGTASDPEDHGQCGSVGASLVDAQWSRVSRDADDSGKGRHEEIV
jgi:hypothetical protein